MMSRLESLLQLEKELMQKISILETDLIQSQKQSEWNRSDLELFKKKHAELSMALVSIFKYFKYS